jgi:hypothetical protein
MAPLRSPKHFSGKKNPSCKYILIIERIKLKTDIYTTQNMYRNKEPQMNADLLLVLRNQKIVISLIKRQYEFRFYTPKI